MSSPTSAAYKIGTNFCLQFGSTSPTPTTNVDLNLQILNLQGNREQGIAAVFPTPDVTVEKDGVIYYSVPRGTNPDNMITVEFMMEYPYLMPGAASFETPQALSTAVFGDRLTFTSYFTLRNASITMSTGRAIFESLLGTWTTTVNNSLGGETCSSTIRECLCEGLPPVLPGCMGPLFPADRETVPVGCSIYIPEGTYVNLDCGVISGNTTEIEYSWERDNVTVSTARVLQVHFEWSYTCTVTNLDGMNSATTDVYWLTPINRVANGLSHSGNEFVLAFLQNDPGDTGDQASERLTILVSTVEPTPVNFTIETDQRFSPSITSGTTSYGSSTPVTFSPNIAPEDIRVNVVIDSFTLNDLLNIINVRVKAEGEKKITVFGLNDKLESSDAFLALPCQSYRAVTGNFEYEYFIFSANQNPGRPTRYRSAFLITTCQDDTEITILPSVTAFYQQGSTFGGVPSGALTANARETILVEASDSMSDLTGTIVTSTKPISVFSGHVCGRVPAGLTACDHLIEQIPPHVVWGTTFFTVPLTARRSGDRFRVGVIRDNTVINVTCVTPGSSTVRFQASVTRNRSPTQPGNNYYEFDTPGTGPMNPDPNYRADYCCIQTNTPVAVMQYSKGHAVDELPSSIGDPFMMLVPPVEQSLNNFTLSTRSTSRFTNYINVAISAQFFDNSTADQAKVLLNGAIVAPLDATWIPIFCYDGSLCGYGAQASLSDGDSTLIFNDPSGGMNVYTYGFGREVSYGYPGGFQMEAIGLPHVTLSPVSITVRESAGMVTVRVIRSGDITSGRSIVYFNTRSTATGGATAGECSSAGSDYVALPQGIPDSLPEARRKRFRRDATTSRDGDIVIVICNDTVEEESETFEVYLTNEYIENAYLFPHRVATVTILDSVRIVTVGFERCLYSVGEEDRQAKLCVDITVPRRQDIGTISFNLMVETQNGSAVSPDDYMSVSMTLGTFTGQCPRQCFSISITNDAIIEQTEHFTTRLTVIPASVTSIDASRIVVDPPETTVQIVDNDLVVVVGYSRAYVNVFEADRQAEFIVSINGPALFENSFYLLVNTQDRTATAPGDYGNLTDFRLGPFSDDVRQLSFNVSIVNDNITEDAEKFSASLTLDSVVRAELVGNVTVFPDVATATIVDNDVVVAGYVQTTMTVLESDGVAQLQLTVAILAAQLDASFSLLVNTSDRTATAPGDYGNLVNFRVGPFNNSVRQLSFNLSILNDNSTEDAEMFSASLTLDPDDQARLGNQTRVTVSPEVAIVTIQDDEEITVGYVETAVNVSESDGVAQLTVAISMPPEADPIETLFFLLVNTLDETATATAPSDFGNLMNFRLGPFNNSVRQLSFNVSIVDDSIPEEDKLFNVSLTLDPDTQPGLRNRVTVSPHVTTLTIQDNEIVVGYTMTDVSVSESDGVAQLTVAISMPPEAKLIETFFSLIVNTLDGAATAPGDYGNFTNFRIGPFNNSVRQLSFNMSIVDENIPEDDEMFNVSLTLDPADQARLGNRGIVSPDVATVMIQDNDEIIVGYTVTDMTVLESEEEATLTVAITMPPRTDLIETSFSLLVNTLDGTATAPGDYGNLTNFHLDPSSNDDVRQLSFNVSIVNDSIPEDAEMFNVSLTLDPAVQARLGNRVTVSPHVATITIQDDDTITVGYVETAVNVSESNGMANLTVRISIPPKDVPIETSFSLLVNTPTGVPFYVRRNITADNRAAAFCDYGALTNISLGSFNNDTRELYFNVSIVNDNSPENDEIFYVNLTVNHTDQARLGDRVTVSPHLGAVTIQDNDEITVGYIQTAVTVSESDGVAQLTVKISMPHEDVPIDSEVLFSLVVNTLDGTATAPYDYDAQTKSLGEFSNDERELSFNVSIMDDSIPEDAEMFNVSLTLASQSSRVTVSPAEATITIKDDEIVVIQQSVNVSESDGEAQLTVAISMPPGADPIETSFSLIVNTLDGTATAPDDYGNLTNFTLGPFSDDVRQLSFNVSIVNDSIPEDAEMFSANLTLDPADQARLGNRVIVDVANVKIQDDDVITVGYVETAVNVSEGDGMVNLTVAISMPPGADPMETSFSLIVNTLDGTATDSDYDALANFRLGPFSDDVRELSFNVSIVDDNTPESAEMFHANLTLDPADQARLVTVSYNAATVTIQDDDVPTSQLSTLVSYSMTPSPPQTAGTTQVDVGVILGSSFAAMVIVILCIGIAIFAVVYLRRRQHAKKVDLTRIDEMKEMNPYIAQGSQVTHGPYTDVPKLLISSNCIRLLNVVGQGEFGVVYKAHLVKFMQQMPEVVAVKTLKGFYDQRSAADMMKESAKMQGFEHPHVLNITGVCVDAGPSPYIIMPFMANGSLLAYIKKEKMNLVIPNDAADEELATVALKRLADMCIQIGKGMEYLASKMIVHRDLAARNCMIDAHFVIKVADFGLSENMYSKTYFRQEKDQAVKLPVKWLALEALTEGVFSEKSDVWSYGVTCWELFTGGRVPYPGVDPVSLPHLLESGHRLDKPNNAACSEEIYLFMLKCWHGDPEERPTFSELVSLMSQTLESLAGYMDVSTFGKLEVHGEDPHDEAPHDEATNEGANDEDQHGEDPHCEDPHCETKV